jgi:hypothetical protein
MTRSYGLTSRNRIPVAHRKPARDPSVTNLGFACFRLVAIDADAAGAPAYSWLRVLETRNAMASLMSDGPTKREQFMRQISALDRVLQASLARSPRD